MQLLTRYCTGDRGEIMQDILLELNEYELKEIMIALEHQYDRFADNEDIEKTNRANRLWDIINKVADARKKIREKNGVRV